MYSSEGQFVEIVSYAVSIFFLFGDVAFRDLAFLHICSTTIFWDAAQGAPSGFLCVVMCGVNAAESPEDVWYLGRI
jgi:uncharacterized membrane protein